MINQRLCMLKIYYIQANLSSYDEYSKLRVLLCLRLFYFWIKLKKISLIVDIFLTQSIFIPIRHQNNVIYLNQHHYVKNFFSNSS